MINRAPFYNYIREHLFGGHLTGLQVEGIEAILNEWEKRALTDNRWLAYILATAKHETAKTMQPIEEYGKGAGRSYGKRDDQTGKVYYGRGFVQLTWRGNYEKMGHLLNVDLVNNPEFALQPIVATQIMFEGMLRGMFTGRTLTLSGKTG